MSNKWKIALLGFALVGVAALAGCAEPGPQEAGEGNDTTQNQTPTEDNQTNTTSSQDNQSGMDPLQDQGNDTSLVEPPTGDQPTAGDQGNMPT